MSFPMINFKVKGTDVTDELKSVAESKLAILEKHIGDAPAVCDLEFERITNHHQQGNIHRVEVNLEINGKLYRAEATDESFEKAIDAVKEELGHEIRSSHGKRDTLIKRGARRMKEMMRFS